MNTPKKATKPVPKQNKEGKLLYLFPEQLIVEEGFNTRYDMGNLEELAKSIITNGLIHPILGHSTGKLNDDGYPIYTIIDGHRRFAAIRHLIDTQQLDDSEQTVLFKKMPDEWTLIDRTLCMLNTSGHSKQFELLEMAEAIKRVKDEDGSITNAEIAAKIGKSAAYVGDCLLLINKAEEKQLDRIRAGRIAASAVIALLKEARMSGATNEELEEIIEETLTTKDKVTKRDIDRKLGKEKKAAPKTSIEEDGFEEQAKPRRIIPGSGMLSQSGFEVLTDLKARLKAQNLPAPIAESYELLSALIDYVRGTKDVSEIIDHFHVIVGGIQPKKDLEDLEFEEVKKIEPKAVKKDKPAKPAPVVYSAEDDDDDLPVKPAKKSKPAPVEEDELELVPAKKGAAKEADSPFKGLPKFNLDLDQDEEE